MKNTKKLTRKLDLDAEVVADLEASEHDAEAVKGGGKTIFCNRSAAATGNA